MLEPYAIEFLGLPEAAIKQEGTGRAGRFDSMFGSSIIEFKRPGLLRSRAERSKAATQALAYLEDRALGARVVVVTDGETWGILRDMQSAPEVGEQMLLVLDGAPVMVPDIARFAWRETSLETCQAVLDLIGSQRATPVTSANVIAFMGLVRAEVLLFVAELTRSLRSRVPKGRTDVLFEQWVRTAGTSYGIKSTATPWPTKRSREELLGVSLASACSDAEFAEVVYCLHSYIAIASKLIAAEVLAIQRQQPHYRPTQWVSLAAHPLGGYLDALESGEISDQLSAPGLLASDLFDWYSHEMASSDALRDAFRDVLRSLAQLAWAEVANRGGVEIDLLRDLYQSVMPRSLRKALGEFFTPRWLAEYVLTRALAEAQSAGIVSSSQLMPRYLDPSCGSGTFLVTALRIGLQRLDSMERDGDLDAVLELVDAIHGIDINPVSALMSRVNLLLALGDRAAQLPEVRFNVYQADSILLPRVETTLTIPIQGGFTGGDQFGISTSVGDFGVPTAMLTGHRMAVLRGALEVSLRADRSAADFLAMLSGGLSKEGVDTSPDGAEWIQLRAPLAGLYEQISELRRQNRDDVWARVLEQSVAPFLMDDMQLVVGNPPWITWRDLPEVWKRRSEPLWRRWGLWQAAQRGGGSPRSDIATLMLARTIETYAPHGLIAMLVPESLVIADPGGSAFRRSHLRPDPEDAAATGGVVDIPYRVTSIDDFVEANPFSPDASNRTVVLYIRPGQGPTDRIPRRKWSRVPRARVRSGMTWLQARDRLQVRDDELAPVDSRDMAAPWGTSQRVGGLQLVPRETGAPYAFGRGYNTRGKTGIFVYTISTEHPVGGLVRVRSEPGQGRSTRHDTPREGKLEPALLRPWIKGEDVQRWVVADTGRYILTMYRDVGGEGSEISQLQCARDYVQAYKFLTPVESEFLGRSFQRGQPRDAFPWELEGPTQRLLDDGAFVYVREFATAGRPAAAVCEARFDPTLGRKTLPVPNHKGSIFIASPDEAHYLAGFINSEPAQEALSRFVSPTAVSPRAFRRLPMPQYDSTNDEHAELSRLARHAAAAVSAGDGVELMRLESRMDAIVLELGALVSSGTTNSKK